MRSNSWATWYVTYGVVCCGGVVQILDNDYLWKKGSSHNRDGEEQVSNPHVFAVAYELVDVKIHSFILARM